MISSLLHYTASNRRLLPNLRASKMQRASLREGLCSAVMNTVPPSMLAAQLPLANNTIGLLEGKRLRAQMMVIVALRFTWRDRKETINLLRAFCLIAT